MGRELARPALITIRAELMRVVLAATLPVWLALAAVLYEDQMDERALIERDASATARSLMVAFDRELASAKTAALVLATSPDLQSDDLRAFYGQASAILGSTGANNIVLRDGSGQPMLNTLIPYGEPLRRNGDEELARRVFANGVPMISDLYFGALHRPMISVDVPVLRGGKVVYDLSIGFFSERLGDLLQQEQFPASWVASIFDSKGFNAARTNNADRFVGQRGVPALVSRMAQVSVGIVETETLEGVSSTVFFDRSQLSNWTVAIYVPAAELTMRLWKAMALSIAGTLVLLVFGFVGARVAGERVAQQIRSLAALALAYGQGKRIEKPLLRLKEADDVVRAFVEGSRLLENRTAERDRIERQRQQNLMAKEVAEEAARQRSAYFAYLSHELRTPLAAVLGSAELIEHHTRATSRDHYPLEYCRRISGAVQHLISIIDEILDYARYEAREIALRKEPLDVVSEVRGAVTLLEGRAKQANVELRYQAASNLPPLFSDKIRLRQIMLNLLSNALKFTRPGGTVTVTAALAKDAQLEIRVKDTGIGISADDLPRVLQPFAQVLNAQSKESKGTGLGLPLTKGLVELHGGTLAIASTLGVGTTVTVRMPMHRNPSGS